MSGGSDTSHAEQGSQIVRTSNITHNDLCFHRRSWGSGNDGPHVLLLHGLSSNARVWDLVAPRLAEAGLQASAFDMRGHGLSAKPDSGYDFATFAEDLYALAEACRISKPILVGHSFGAMLALEFAARYRDGDGAPAGIVLVDGGMAQLDAYPGATWEGVLQVLAPPAFELTTLSEFKAQLASADRKWRPDGQALDLILTNFVIREDGTIKPRMNRAHHIEALRALWKFKTYERFERVRCPVLMLPVLPPKPHTFEEGIHLELKERALEQASVKIHDLRVTWLKDCVHDAPLQKPGEVADHILAFASTLAG